MPRVHTLKTIARTITILAPLAAVPYVIIFGRHDLASFLATAAALVPRAFKFAVALLTGLALLCLFFVWRIVWRFLWAAPGPSYDDLELKDQIAAENDFRATRIQVIATAVQALGGIAVLIGIYLAWANLRTTQEGQKETLRTMNEGQITDRFTKAIDQLGATNDKGTPRMELRLGGIYALESIANASPEYHWPIMEILTTYVRVHDPVPKKEGKSSEPAASPNTQSESLNPWASAPRPTPPSPDIQAIITVLGRRDRSFEKGKNEYLDLSNTNLDSAVLNDGHFEWADFSGAHLIYARINGAYLNGATFKGVDLEDADLTDTYLIKATLQFVMAPQASFENAYLNGATLHDVNLQEARFDNAHLNGATVNTLTLTDAVLFATDLRNVVGLTQEEINSANGDKHTQLPTGLKMPERWNEP